MSRLPVPARIYVCGVIALAGCVLAGSLPRLAFPRPGLFLALFALSVISSAVKVDLPLGVGSSCISLSFAVNFAALLLLGVEPTMIIAIASAWSQCTYRMKERNPPHRTLFSMASLALSVAAAGAMYASLGGTRDLVTPMPLQPMLAAAMTHFLVNSVTVAFAFALATRRPVLRLWYENFLWSATSYLVGGVAASLVVEVFQHAGQWQTAIAFVPLCLTYGTYRIYLNRIADEQRNAADWARLHRESIEVLARAIQAKDGTDSAYIDRVQQYASALAHRLNLPESETEAVETAAVLYDIGKLAVPEHILSKPGPLTPDERRKVQIHAQIGADIVGAVPFPCVVTPIIRSHHERWDGKGYPSGLRGTDIPHGARILAVVDCFVAVTSDRPYRRAMSHEAALRILHEQAGKAFDPGIVEQFQQILPLLSPPSDEDGPGRLRLLKGAALAQEALAAARTRKVDAFAEIASANRESYTLYEIARAMGRTLSVTEAMTLISSKVSALMPFSSCALFVRESGADLRCRFAAGLDSEMLQDVVVPDGAGLSGWVVRHGRPLVNGVPEAEFTAAGFAPGTTRLQSALIYPLSAGDQVIGAVAVFHVQPGCYREDHRRVLEEICQQASAVVHNALRFEQTQDEALKDGLTGLANARALQFQVARELALARRTSAQFSLVMLDLDDFKTINDEYGHLAGDRALREAARALRETTRPYDTCIRYGGDEFVVVIASCGRAEAENRRRQFQEALATITVQKEDGVSIRLSASAGVGVFPEDGDSFERLLARADARMYKEKAERKASGRLRVCGIGAQRVRAR